MLRDLVPVFLNSKLIFMCSVLHDEAISMRLDYQCLNTKYIFFKTPYNCKWMIGSEIK